MNKIDLTKEERIIAEALKASRHVQEYIWGEDSLMLDKEFDLNLWVSIFQKRVIKISEIRPNSKSARIELRKRVLQQAALSILALRMLDCDQK